MIRTGASRAFLRSCKVPTTSLRASYNTTSLGSKIGSCRPAFPGRRPEPFAVVSYETKKSLACRHASFVAAPGTTRSDEKEHEYGLKKLRAEPEAVSADSTTQAMISSQESEADPDPMEGIRHDIKVIQETFALNEVPTEAYRIGLAGVLPYLATSAATVGLAFELNTAIHNYGQGYFLSQHNAEAILQFVEPIQVGYGATIISFLGAIHWGLEWAGYGGHGGYRRYAIGVIAPAVAWPTILLPVEEALITQFLTFVVLYAVDNSTTVRGWTPPWYSTYRFVLTAIVGASIVITLIGRGQIQERVGTLPSATQRLKEIHTGPYESGVEQKVAEDGGEEEE